MTPNEYIEQHGEDWQVRGSRVSLDSLIHAFHDGLSPEAIARECFPTLQLAQVYGAIAFYLAHRPETDAYLAKGRAEGADWRRQRQASEPAFVQRMAQARRELLASAP